MARSRRDLFALIALACGGLALLAVISQPYWSRVTMGHTDFLSFYAGGRLAFTPGLYDPPQSMAEQIRAAHVSSEGTYFIRMPWFAAAMWPLARLPYVPAQLIWQALLFAGLTAFVAFWPRPSLALRAAILCFSLPALISILMGQDVPLLLASMAVSLALLRRGRPLLAGLVLSLTLAKFHLFLPLFPAVLFARRWRFSAGLFGGTSLLLAASFLVSGADWPRRFLTALKDQPEVWWVGADRFRKANSAPECGDCSSTCCTSTASPSKPFLISLKDPAITPSISTAPSFYYLIHGTPAVRNLAMAALGAVLMILYLRMARKNVEFLIAAAPAVILPLLPHAGAYDGLLLTPLAMLALEAGSREAKIAGALLLIPVTYFAAWSVSSLSMLIPLLDVALLGLSTFQSSSSPAAPVCKG